MTPIDFPETTLVIAKNQPQYLPLPSYRYQHDDEGRVVFCWKLSWPERISLLLTGKLWHSVLTFNRPLQPQVLSLDKPLMPPHETL